MARPFFVDGEPRVARAVGTSDWSSVDLEPSLLRIDPITRHLLAGYWTDVGRTKHAAVAAHARLAMQLLSLGAPPELISGAHAAMGEELRHARFAFTIASAFRFMPVGPGPLGVDDAFQGSSVESVLLDVVRAGCVATTIASMELRELLEKVEDSALRFVVSEMARDTAEHVVFAWRTLQWLCDDMGEPARELVRAEASRIAAELNEVRSQPPPAHVPDETLLRAGYVSGRVRRDVKLAALERSLFGLRAVADDAMGDDESERVTVA